MKRKIHPWNQNFKFGKLNPTERIARPYIIKPMKRGAKLINNNTKKEGVEL